MSTTILSSHVPHDLLSVSDLPLVIHSGKLHAHWTESARSKGFDLIARVQDRFRVALRCQPCGGVHVARYSVVMTAQPLCPHCVESRWRATALGAGLTWLGRDPDHRHYGRYGLPCGHESRRQFSFVERVASGAVAPRCETCLVHREELEATHFDWTRLGRDPQGKANYRLYRHHCGHKQRIAVANMRWGQCDCAGCGQSWTAKPSYIYLLDIRHPQTKRHYLKLGYSSHPVKRHKHQLGLPKDALVEVLRVVAMPTGHDACAREKAAHARLKRAHPEALVPHPEYADLMNVVSEIYRPEALSILHDTLTHDPAIDRRVALHECGHAIACAALRLGPVRRIFLGRDGDGGTVFDADAKHGLLSDLQDRLVQMLAGRAAERLILGDVSAGAGGSANSDLAQATTIATSIQTRYGLGAQGPVWTADPETLIALGPDVLFRVRRELEAAEKRATQILSTHRALLEEMAEALMASRDMDRAEAQDWLDRVRNAAPNGCKLVRANQQT